MTTKTFEAPATGPVVFELEAAAAAVTVTIDPAAATATAELSGPSEVVNDTRSMSAPGRWVLDLPKPKPAVIGGGSIVINHNGGTVIGTVVTGDSMTFVNGRLVGGVNITTIQGTEPAHLAVILPAGSRLAVRLTSGKLSTYGQLPDATIITTSADVEINTVGTLRARTISGDITADTVTTSAGLNTVSGDIDIDETTGPVTAQTVSGDITIGAGSDVVIGADSVSGDITVRAARGSFPDVRAHSVSGDVRNRRGGAL